MEAGGLKGLKEGVGVGCSPVAMAEAEDDQGYGERHSTDHEGDDEGGCLCHDLLVAAARGGAFTL